MRGSASQRPGRAPAPPTRKPLQTLLSAVALVVFAAGTITGFVIARDRARDDVSTRAEQTAVRAATRIDTELDRRLASLAGSSAILDGQGVPRLAEFRAYAEDLLEAGGLTAVLLVGADGDAREVLAVEPGDAAVPMVGADLTDSTWRLAITVVESTGMSTVSDLLDLGRGQRGVALVRPLASAGEFRGAVVGGVTLERLEGLLGAGADLEVALVDGEELLAGAELDPRDETASAPLEVTGQGWTVMVRTTAEPDLTLAWLTAAGGATATAVMAALILVTASNQRRLSSAFALVTESEARTRAVQELAARLARGLTSEDVARALLDHLPGAVGSRSAMVALVDEAGALRIRGREREDDTLATELGWVGSGALIDTVLTDRQPVWLSSPFDWQGNDAVEVLAEGGASLALLPLAAGDIRGLLAVSYPRVKIFAPEEQRLLQTIGILAARALSRGRRYDTEHRAAVAFQRAALPDHIPDIDGLTVAARYRPATERATVGGDWYDVVRLDDDRVILVVGDVVGHGMVAAATMGRLRTAFQAIAPLCSGPGDMLQALSQQTTSIPNSFCTTVVCVQVDIAAGSISWCRAGHPPALHLHGDDVDLLDARSMPPLGVVLDAEATVHRRDIAPGDRIVLYTDGLVERRGEEIDASFDRMRVVAADLADLEPDEFSDALVEALVEADEQADDLALLVVRYDGR